MGRVLDLLMRATDNPTTALRATEAANAVGRSVGHSHPNVAAAAGAAAALVVAADRVLHTNAAPAGTYATFDTDKPKRRRRRTD